MGFNISWLRRGHPVLNVRDLSTEASHSLGLLLDQLRSPTVKSLSNSVIIVLIKRYFINSYTPFDCCPLVNEASGFKRHTTSYCSPYLHD